MASTGEETTFSLFDGRPVTATQWRVLGLCALCMVIDGFDVQAMAYAAPALIKAWGASRSVLGPVFAAGLLGMFAGSLVLAGWADTIGRRPMLIAATAWIALCMVLTPFAHSIGALIGIRFAAGIGMGAIVPNAMALAGEYSPARIRVSLMMAVSSGYIVGGVVGGGIAALVIAPFGWGGVFYAGALLTALLSLSMFAALPESLQFCLLRHPQTPRTLLLLHQVAPGAAMPTVPPANKALGGNTLTMLLGEGRRIVTPLLWVANFANMLCAYFLAAWIPVLMSGTGYSSSKAVLAGTALWLGGLVGNVALGMLIDRRGFAAVLFANFALGGVAIVGISYLHTVPLAAISCIAFAGFCILGGQSGLNALAVTIYPTRTRATGAGWALGFGRLGAVLGPLAGGQLMALAWSVDQTLLVSAVPTVLAAVAVGSLGRLHERRVKRIPASG
ncbi:MULTISPECIES: MFS transporter [Paraburkholderia]|jgi:AAHS family 4-hydroxybenzoate transporter-like MFS transporter|uniref:MFS transporter n=1 Tax=Paraburkholderia madseniana TaxID=2599607 RepID=A0A6N6WFT4_9BURK|nr:MULTISPECIES: MFS transporter [Paraburkholderia]KAE8758768.1 MFS transporter [Paraburkholderia madseniana]MCX4174790.1 MFS transporter [Paraburkholderia madseniana]MDQ6462791.1 MFS transporter [Paraburkholderia madseniana]